MAGLQAWEALPETTQEQHEAAEKGEQEAAEERQRTEREQHEAEERKQREATGAAERKKQEETEATEAGEKRKQEEAAERQPREETEATARKKQEDELANSTGTTLVTSLTPPLVNDASQPVVRQPKIVETETKRVVNDADVLTISLLPHDVLLVEICCGAPNVDCRGTITLQTDAPGIIGASHGGSKGHRASLVTLARASYTLRAGHVEMVKLRAPSRVKKLLARGHAIRTQATLVSASAAEGVMSRTTLTIRRNTHPSP